jgi:hypothetical protein
MIVQLVRKVAVHLGYSPYIWLSVPKLPFQCAVVSLYSVVKQRLSAIPVKCATVCFSFYSLWFFQLRNVFCC